MTRAIWLLLTVLLLGACNPLPKGTHTVREDLRIRRLTGKTYLVQSFMTLKTGVKFPCNSLLYLHGKEAILFDTPHTLPLSKALLDYVEGQLSAKLTAVVVNHFHEDCLGGLDVFHQCGIPSFSSRRTRYEAEKAGATVPQFGFPTTHELPLGSKRVRLFYPGEAHAPGNIVAWLPSEGVLFGGCMVKAAKSGKGNLSDANLHEWANSVEKVKARYPNAKVVVPGHGKPGGIELLDYTIEMFRAPAE